MELAFSYCEQALTMQHSRLRLLPFLLSTFVLFTTAADAWTTVQVDTLLTKAYVDLAPYLEYTTDAVASVEQLSDEAISWKSMADHSERQSYETLFLDDTWPGEGWFRLSFTIADQQQPIMVGAFVHDGYEIYLDGTLLRQVGTFKDGVSVIPRHDFVSLDPVLDRTDSTQVHELVFHVQTSTFRYMMNDGEAVGFHAWMAITDVVVPNRAASKSSLMRNVMIPLGTVLTLGLLHLLLFIFARRDTVNLLYTAFAFALAGILFSLDMQLSTTSPWMMDVSNVMNVSLWAVIIAIALLLISKLYYGSISRTRLIVVTSAAGAILVVPYLVDGVGTLMWGAFVCIATLDFVRLTVVAVRRRVEGAWIIGSGLLLFSVHLITWFFGTYLEWIDLPMDVRRIISITGYISMPLSMSVFLALRITRTNRDLSRQLDRVETLTDEKIRQERRVIEEELRRQQLEADNERKTHELEEARKLQLSMLPTTMPSIDRLQMSIAMNTATEVGGDYVDYYVHGPNAITYAVGDATGHGMKAGVMVAAAKSHFQTHAPTESHAGILSHAGDGIRRLNLRGLYMCLGLLTIRGTSCTWTSAGIPPLLHYRAATGNIDHHVVKGLPLGAPRNGDSTTIAFEVEEGDVLLAMTDGLPELFDPARRSLGYEHIERTFREHVDRSTTEIVDQLVELADTWRSGRSYNDDITLLAIKVT